MHRNNIEVKGQEKLIKDISKIFKIFKASEATIRPHFILSGESGSVNLLR